MKKLNKIQIEILWDGVEVGEMQDHFKINSIELETFKLMKKYFSMLEQPDNYSQVEKDTVYYALKDFSDFWFGYLIDKESAIRKLREKQKKEQIDMQRRYNRVLDEMITEIEVLLSK